ncbi:MAG TPA: phosphopantothenoylcysteine decarboxylase [Verrucomicrobiota bacterium]|nr:phosphopantothenoylcysteine decarboxylase [Verrucomicrobiota bacterium]
MNCIVTAGPTFEPLDGARRITNFSTGRLGVELSKFLVASGHHVTLFVGQQATYCGERRAHRVETFSTTANLREQLQALSSQNVQAVFHAAAVSDFSFGKVWVRDASGELREVKSGKISTRDGALLAELIPTPKIIVQLRAWFPAAFLAGWKYEVDGKRADVVASAQRQLRESLTDICVANGPAYGDGFGLVTTDGHSTHLPGQAELFESLEKMLRA